MIPIIDYNADASTTINREKIEYNIPEVSTEFDEEVFELKFLNQELSSIFTNLSIEPYGLTGFNDSYFSDNFEVIVRFEYKNSKTVKARLHRAKFEPTIIID